MTMNFRNFLQKIYIQAFGSQLRLNMLSGVISILINISALAISYPVYLHYLGYEKFGLWLILAVVLSFAQLGMLGIGSAVTKLVAEEYGRGNLQGVQSYVAMALVILTFTGTIALLAIFIFKSQIIAAFKLDNENAEIVSWLLPYIGILSVYVFLVQALNATLSGLGRMDLANYIQAIGRITMVGISVLLLFRGRGVESLLIGNVCSYVAIHIMTLWFIRWQTKIRFLRLDNWNWQRLKRLLSFGGGIFGGMLMNMLLDPFNKLILSRYAGVASIPVYDIAFKASMQIRAIGETGFRAMMPEISHVSVNMTESGYQRIVTLNRKALKLIIFCGIPIFGSLFILSEVFLKIWLRQSFTESLPPVFRVILVGTFLSLLCVPSFYTLLGLGEARYFLFSSAIQGAVNASIITVFIMLMDKISAYSIGWAIMIAMSMTSCYIIIQKYRVMKNARSSF